MLTRLVFSFTQWPGPIWTPIRNNSGVTSRCITLFWAATADTFLYLAFKFLVLIHSLFSSDSRYQLRIIGSQNLLVQDITSVFLRLPTSSGTISFLCVLLRPRSTSIVWSLHLLCKIYFRFYRHCYRFHSLQTSYLLNAYHDPETPKYIDITALVPLYIAPFFSFGFLPLLVHRIGLQSILYLFMLDSFMSRPPTRPRTTSKIANTSSTRSPRMEMQTWRLDSHPGSE